MGYGAINIDVRRDKPTDTTVPIADRIRAMLLVYTPPSAQDIQVLVGDFLTVEVTILGV